MKIKICEICGRTSVETIIVTSNGHHYCNRYYQRMRNSKVYPLPLKGEVKYREDGKPICHICGRSFNKLMLHVYQVHNMTSY